MPILTGNGKRKENPMIEMRIGSLLKLTVLVLTLSTLLFDTAFAQENQIGDIRSLYWSPDGAKLIANTNKGIYLYDRDFRLLVFESHRDSNYPYIISSWSPDSQSIIVGKEIWDASTLKPILTMPTEFGVTGWNKDGTQVFSLGSEGREIIILDAVSGQIVHKLPTVPIEWAKWSPDNTRFATALGSAVMLIDAVQGNIIAQYNQSGIISSIEWSPDSSKLAFSLQTVVQPNTLGSHATDGSVAVVYETHILNTNTGQLIQTFSPLPDYFVHLRWTPDSSELIGLSGNGNVFVWDILTGKIVDSFQTPGRLGAIALSPYGGRLFVASNVLEAVDNVARGAVKPISAFSENVLNGAILVAVPHPSEVKLQAITQACGVQPSVQQSLTAQITTNKLQDFTKQVSALTDAQIPPGCKADLLAVAEALMAKGQ
jgi:WD40 repeat protein